MEQVSAVAGHRRPLCLRWNSEFGSDLELGIVSPAVCDGDDAIDTFRGPKFLTRRVDATWVNWCDAINAPPTRESSAVKCYFAQVRGELWKVVSDTISYRS